MKEFKGLKSRYVTALKKNGILSIADLSEYLESGQSLRGLIDIGGKSEHDIISWLKQVQK